jgi:hypothetical protein
MNNNEPYLITVASPVAVVESLANGYNEIGVGVDLATITLA